MSSLVHFLKIMVMKNPLESGFNVKVSAAIDIKFPIEQQQV